MVDYADIGKRIRTCRLAKGMTQEQLANEVGVVVTHISHIETGNSVPSLKTLIDIINAHKKHVWVRHVVVPDINDTPEDMEEAARRIYSKGCKNVLVKGGKNIAGAVDVLFDGETCHRIEIEQINTTSTHGTGCTLSSAIASNLALGHSVPEAVKLAKEYVTDAIRHAPGLGHGCGPLNHFCRIFPEE